ncbi:SMP-30/gluconolactonase/LRE family protein [Flavobacterium cheongpyeongense]|jgi:gluconolactonase|uniref:SMP-30/gluconolactonase/LRE family protein n=1 Tax=Flavobacterium cheongpyeongense TaxID=2212651 RepID=UPI001402007E|nr:SMP-30/gluconolactonase/LRE family protein [Flavobacterium cheongpyeongense]
MIVHPGEKIVYFDVKEPWKANVSFGGKKFKTLLITTAKKCLYTGDEHLRKE